ncbi:acetylxylan esterase [Siphonobacter aquaeclarae]|uniref:Cephalosporin-C deacetylase n=1 Tax=Siphonobacter aquaeclarae TaxID=563176 RepID=A0A1G9WZ29_9BACT|nr:acetylxylan esterase [Siphonobacter aquaeclarae]SDM89710.1 Cephalosporin-C deacetylase [Siphonobacter aquaeclarae]
MKNVYSACLRPVFLLCLLTTVAVAQPSERIIKVNVAPEKAGWTYKTGENIRFAVSVTQWGQALKGVKVRYQVGPEKMTPTRQETTTLSNGTLTVDGGSLKTGGFVQCLVFAEVDGKEYKGIGSAGVDPESIQPTVENPSDFDAFWDGAKAELAKIPLDARSTLLPERCTEKVNVYHVNIQNIGGSRLYGILCVPKAPGKYPALLRVPGAGVRPYNGDVATAEKGIITLEIGIHGVPVNLDPAVYTSLGAGALQGYYQLNLDSRDRYYYKRVYLGCIRANDFLVSLPQYDGQHLAVTGGSQGGALSLVTAGLDPRVKSLGAFYPALCDVTGYLKGRAGGWPHLFAGSSLEFNNKPDKVKTCGYYDVVNFARRVKVPGYYSWGYNDETCPPTSMYAAYNVISAPKTLYLAYETGHWTYPEQGEKVMGWLLEQLQR